MCDDKTLHDFDRSSPGASGGAGANSAMPADPPPGSIDVEETEVFVATEDGTADAVLVHPKGGGRKPAVLIWVDIMGLRPVYCAMARRLAAQGYVVLVPNLFYRSGTAAEITAANHNFMTPEGRAALFGFYGEIRAEGAVRDSVAYLSFLDAQPQTDTGKLAGVHGYCIGGPLSFRTASAVPDRIGAVGAFHANGLATGETTSPHLLIARTSASYLVGLAQNDDAKDPDTKTILRQTFAATGQRGTVEVYPADHGWCVPGVPVYDHVQAERAWGELSALYEEALV